MPIPKWLADNNYLVTGRGSAAIYLILAASGIRNSLVLVPANICYAAIYPILYSGNLPLFVDAGRDGNPRFQFVHDACETHGHVAAAILPHMYGNPCLDLPQIAAYLKGRNYLVIEDCASAMGVQVDRQPAGTYSDYVVYSFGYSKTIEVGFGGLVTSKRSLDMLETRNEELPEYNSKVDRDIRLFSDLYRVLRHHVGHSVVQHIFQLFPDAFQECFLHKVSAAQQTIIWEKVATLETVIEQRISKAQQYRQVVRFHDALCEYRYHSGAVPWRFNVLVKSDYKERLLQHLLRNQIPVSDWYPVVAPMFGVTQTFPNCEQLAREILNFPLDQRISREEIERIGVCINDFWDTVER